MKDGELLEILCGARGQTLHPGRLPAVVHADACAAGLLASPAVFFWVGNVGFNQDYTTIHNS